MTNAVRRIQNYNKTEFQLSESDIKQFIEDGYVTVKQLFSYEDSEKISNMVREEIGMETDNSAAHKQSYLILKKILRKNPIPQIFSEQYKKVVNELCGLGRWQGDDGLGYWFITFPGFNQSVWSPSQNEWHIDCNTDYCKINNYKLAVVAFHLITSVAQGGAGTAIRVGSHKYTAQILAEAGLGGISYSDLSRKAANATKNLPYIETTGKCGDVVFMHPLTVHARSLNTSGQVRIAGHKFFHLLEPLNINRESEREYSPVEIAVLKALSKADKN